MQWIAYSIGVALLLGAAAWAAEAALRSLGRPARGVWLAALAGSVLLPAYAAAGGPLPGLLPFPVPLPASADPAALALAAASPGTIAPVPAPAPSDPWFPLAWALASGALLGLLLLLELRLRREGRGWLESVVDGVPVLVSRDVGPAVAGLVRGRIVLPTWALRLDAPVVRAIIAHEAEHLRAGDPRTLLAGLLAVCALPWNPVLWWQYRRLALAVELDCDARVLAALRDPRAYGLALLETARRRSRGPLLHAALLRPRSFLRRRIEMMGRFAEHRMTVRALASAGVAGIALIAAVCADSPAEPEADAVRAVDATDERQFEVTVVEADSMVYYPEQLRVVAFSPTVTVHVEDIVRVHAEDIVPVKRGLPLVPGPQKFWREEPAEVTPHMIIEQGSMRYIADPQPHWVLSGGRVRFITPTDRTLRVEGKHVRVNPLRADPTPMRQTPHH